MVLTMVPPIENKTQISVLPTRHTLDEQLRTDNHRGLYSTWPLVNLNIVRDFGL